MQSTIQQLRTATLDRVSLTNRRDRAERILSPRSQWAVYNVALALNDVVLAALAFVFAAWIRFNVPLSIFNLEANPTIPSLLVILFVFVPLWIGTFALQGLYRRHILLGGMQEYAGVFRATAIGMLLIVIIGFLQPAVNPARGWLMLAWAFAFLFVSAGRFLLRRIIYWLRFHGFFLSPTLLVGINSEAKSLATQLAGWQTSGLHMLGLVAGDAESPDSEQWPNGLQVIGRLSNLDNLVQDYRVEEIILASSALSQEQTVAIFKRYGMAPRIRLRMSTGFYEILTTGLQVKETASVPLMSVNRVQLTGTNWLLKTGLDYSVAMVALFLTAPLFVMISLLIKLESGGPIFYRRRVLGLNGKQFDAFKFRTMREDGDAIIATDAQLMAELKDNFKLKDDPRVTRIGRWLRRWSLDELPQLFNVMRHEMSVVGPRMISPEEIVKYDQWDMNLLTVLPGMTGLWQVNGRSDLPYEERINLDMSYIRNWSIWLDMQLLFQTIPAVLKARGAY